MIAEFHTPFTFNAFQDYVFEPLVEEMREWLSVPNDDWLPSRFDNDDSSHSNQGDNWGLN